MWSGARTELLCVSSACDVPSTAHLPRCVTTMAGNAKARTSESAPRQPQQAAPIWRRWRTTGGGTSCCSSLVRHSSYSHGRLPNDHLYIAKRASMGLSSSRLDY
ncbi:hypothetical protein L1887_58135 [Cichorium endivia]|nr:hypothetical protein L1887_58135 [Cichorium endivia]